MRKAFLLLTIKNKFHCCANQHLFPTVVHLYVNRNNVLFLHLTLTGNLTGQNVCFANINGLVTADADCPDIIRASGPAVQNLRDKGEGVHPRDHNVFIDTILPGKQKIIFGRSDLLVRKRA